MEIKALKEKKRIKQILKKHFKNFARNYNTILAS